MKSTGAASSGPHAVSQPSLTRLSRSVFVALFVLPAIGFAWLVLGPYGELVEPAPARLLAFAAFSSLGTWMYKAKFQERSWVEAGLSTAVTYAFLYRLAAFIPEVSTYPFSLGWSEASRYYYASLYFSEKIYGVPAPPSVLHPSRYLMQSLPFLLEGPPIWFHRLWQVLLWVGANLLVALLLAKRLARPGRFFALLFVMGAFLFLFQGPVYYHLLVMPALVLAFWDPKRLWRTAAVVLLASAWGGISRINWIPVPGLLAAALYFLDVPQQGRPLWKYLLPPAAWFLTGSLVGLAAQKAYEAFSGNPAAYFGTSFSSDLLWYRLLPSRTYPLGVLPAAILASLPALLAIAVSLYPRWRAYSPLRLLGMGAALLVLFAGGVVVSVKIGGGSNLHNLDAYLLLLLVVGAGICFGRFPPDRSIERQPQVRWVNAAAGMALLAPVFFSITTGGPLPARNLTGAQAALIVLQKHVDEAAAAGREVLFISERQLLTFGQLHGPALVHEYEKVFLMEMAMAGSRSYLDAFEQDLRNHRFSLIVSEPLSIQYQGRYRQFGEENDAWVRSVSEPVLCHYRPVLTLTEFNLQVFEPGNGEACP